MARSLLPPPALDDAPLAPGLYVVATPIGNLRDITLRALDVLAAADLELAEDTRVAAKLLAAYGLSAKLERYDEHGAERTRPKALGRWPKARPSPWAPTPARPWAPPPATSWSARPPPRAKPSSRYRAPRPCWRVSPPRACPPTGSCSQGFRRRKAPVAARSWRTWRRSARPWSSSRVARGWRRASPTWRRCWAAPGRRWFAGS